MVRKIVCKNCGNQLKQVFPNHEKNETKYPGEHVKLVFGKLKNPCICDHCNTDLFPGEIVCAHSIWADYGGAPYQQWEDEYIQI